MSTQLPLVEKLEFNMSYSYSGSLVKNLPAMQEIRVQSLGQEDTLEKEMATHSSGFWAILPLLLLPESPERGCL